MCCPTSDVKEHLAADWEWIGLDTIRLEWKSSPRERSHEDQKWVSRE